MKFIYLITPLLLTSCATHIYSDSKKVFKSDFNKTEKLYTLSSHIQDMKDTKK